MTMRNPCGVQERDQLATGRDRARDENESGDDAEKGS